mgnify:CR=1 FL=1
MAGQDRHHPPTQAALKAALGPAHAAWKALLDAHAELTRDWKWYGQNSGWSLKLMDGKRNLCFLHPQDAFFVVGFTFGHDAVERALASDLPPDIRHAVVEAPVHPEGRVFRLEIRSKDDLPPVHTLLEAKRGPAKSATPAPPTGHQSRADRRSAGARPPAAPRMEHRAPSHRRGLSPG